MGNIARRKHTAVAVLGILCLSVGCVAALAANWPQWRGPSASGSVDENHAPAKLDPEGNLLWQVDLPGPGSSTPIVWNGNIILTCEIEGRDSVLCFDRDGKEAWRYSFGPGTAPRFKMASGCNPSPLTDGERVYVYFKSGTLAALSLQGELMWKVDFHSRYGADTLGWDLGTSPVFANGNLVVAVMQRGKSYLVSLDRETGDEIWRVDRKFKSIDESYDAYTTPLVVDVEGRETVVCWGADHLSGHAADTGELLWYAGDYNPKRRKNWRVIASPAVTDGIAIIPFGRGKHLAAVRLGGEGNITKRRGLWQSDELGSDVPSPAARDGRVYVLGDRGRVTCLHALSGNVWWQAQLPSGATKFFASPVLAGDRLYCAASDGSLFSSRVTAEGLESIESTSVGGSVMASPVVVDGRVLIRGRDTLYCFGEGRE